jgi:hypothetical protein
VGVLFLVQATQALARRFKPDAAMPKSPSSY